MYWDFLSLPVYLDLWFELIESDDAIKGNWRRHRVHLFRSAGFYWVVIASALREILHQLDRKRWQLLVFLWRPEKKREEQLVWPTAFDKQRVSYGDSRKRHLPVSVSWLLSTKEKKTEVNSIDWLYLKSADSWTKNDIGKGKGCRFVTFVGYQWNEKELT